MRKRQLEGAAKGAQYVPKPIPFVTVVTDLATPHPFWLHPKTDLCFAEPHTVLHRSQCIPCTAHHRQRRTARVCRRCFVPSEAFERAAMMRGMAKSQLRMHGLPVRPSFANSRLVDAPAIGAALGLLPQQKTVLVVGGGDGVGKLEGIVEAMCARVAAHNAGLGAGAAEAEKVQVVVICGKNQLLKQRLQEREWGAHVHVVVEGFVTRMCDALTP